MRDWNLLYATSLSYVQTKSECKNANAKMLAGQCRQICVLLLLFDWGLFRLAPPTLSTAALILCGTLDHGASIQMYKINWISGALDLE